MEKDNMAKDSTAEGVASRYEQPPVVIDAVEFMDDRRDLLWQHVLELAIKHVAELDAVGRNID